MWPQNDVNNTELIKIELGCEKSSILW